MSELSSLPLFHRIEGQQVLVLGEGAAAEPKRRLVERAGGIVVDDQQRAIDECVRLAFVAFEDARACEAAAINLRSAGMLVNVVDRPDLCDFTTPSILDRNPVLIAVGTGGASAGLAKHVRLRLERILPQSLGSLAKALFGAREKLRSAYPDPSARRQALDDALVEGGALDALDPSSHERVENWVDGGADIADPATHEFTLASDDPEDLTLKQARLLGHADSVCADPQVPPAILARARADAKRFTCDRLSDQDGACGAARGCAQPPQCPKSQARSGKEGLTVILRRGNAGKA